MVVELEVFFQAQLCIVSTVVGMQTNFFVLALFLGCLANSLSRVTFAVHAYLEAVVLLQTGEVVVVELAILVGVDDFRRAVTFFRFQSCILVEVGGQEVGLLHDSAFWFSQPKTENR